MIEDFSIPLDGKATLVSIVCENVEGHSSPEESNKSLDELRELVITLGLTPGNSHIQHRKRPDASSFVGHGKLLEIAESARENNSKILVFDFELKPGHLKNIKDITKLEIFDRNSIILEIFARHAKTHEAKIQIEISRLEYLLPRLSNYWTHFGRQKGGIGVKGGEGEQQIELDRRIIRDRISFLKKQLDSVITARKEQAKGRSKNVLCAALVGYTNAGKSSLMNKLCKVNILEEDKLFATLDSTYRSLSPDTRPPLVLIDTVGFISNLPPSLINGFKTTLESAIEADLLLVVVDGSSEFVESQIEVTDRVLCDLNLHDKKKIYIYNKKDLVKDELDLRIKMRTHKDAYLVSTNSKKDMTKLRDIIIESLLEDQNYYDLFVPYEDGHGHSKIVGNTNIISTSNHQDGIFYRIKTHQHFFDGLGLSKYILSEEKRKSKI